MILTLDEQDAIGEITNISAGSAVCYLSNSADVDVDISVPHLYEFDVNKDVLRLEGKSLGYRFSFTAFTAGYCAFVLEDNPNFLQKIFGYAAGQEEEMKRIMMRVMENAVEPIERLMEQTIKVSLAKDISDEWKLDWKEEDGTLLGIEFQVLIDSKYHGNVIFVYPDRVAKNLAARFLVNGVALTAI